MEKDKNYTELRDSFVTESLSEFTKIVGRIQILAIVLIIAAPIVWIWIDSDLALNVFLSGFYVLILLGIIHIVVTKIAKKIVESEIDKHIDKELGKNSDDKPKGEFQQRLDDLMKKN